MIVKCRKMKIFNDKFDEFVKKKEKKLRHVSLLN